jgi:hypothetical protein
MNAADALWERAILNDEGTSNPLRLVEIETLINRQLANDAGMVIRLPFEHPRTQFKTMRAVADAAYGGSRGTSAHAWWLW